MADFDEGLAVGLLLGRKKGGGGYRSDIYHDLVDNSLLIYSHKINDTYSFDAKMYVMNYPDIDFRTDLYGVQTEELRNISYWGVKYDDPSEETYKSAQYIYLRAMNTVYGIVVVKKNDSPIYAVISDSAYYGLDTVVGSYELYAYSGYSGRETVFYPINDEYRIESAEISGTAEPVPVLYDISSGKSKIVTGQYTGGCDMNFTYSYINRGFDSRSDESAMIFDLSLEEKYTNNATLNMQNISVFPGARYAYLFGIYTDLSNREISAELQNVLNAVREEAGIPSYPAQYVNAGDVIRFPRGS